MDSGGPIDSGITSVVWSNSRGGSGACSGTTSWSASGIPLVPGENTITVTATDGAGNTGTNSTGVTYTLPVDSTSPVVDQFVVPAHSKSLTVGGIQLHATDVGGSVAAYMITESALKPDNTDVRWLATPPTNYPFPSDGQKQLYAWAKDTSGNVSDGAGQQILVDVTAPRVVAFALPEFSKTNTVTVNPYTPWDDQGVAGCFFSESPATPLAELSGWRTDCTSFSFTSAGYHTLFLWVKDAAGNVSAPAVDSVAIDSVPPAVTKFDLPLSATTLTVPLIFKGADTGGGVTGYLAKTSPQTPSADDPDWSAAPPPSFSFSDIGVKTLYGWVRDAAGNISEVASDGVTITSADKVAPTISAFTVPADWNTLQVPIRLFTVKDLDVKGFLVTANTTTPAFDDPRWLAAQPVVFPVDGEDVWTLYAWAKDAVGNVSAGVSAIVRVDLTPPEISSFVVPVNSASLTVPVSLAGAEPGLRYLITQTADQPTVADPRWSSVSPGSHTFSAEGTWTLWGWVKDAAENISAPLAGRTVTVRTNDSVAPTVTFFVVPPTADSLTFAVTVVGEDDIPGNVAGYLITTISAKSLAGDGRWSPSPPTTYAVASAGSWILYAWAKDAQGNVSNSRSAGVTVTLPGSPSLGQAVNQPGWQWVTGGSAPWFSQSADTYDNESAAQSGAVTNGQTNFLQANAVTFDEPVVLSFAWNTGGGDIVLVANNGSGDVEIAALRQTKYSWATDWLTDSVRLVAGTYTLRWEYRESPERSANPATSIGRVDAITVTPILTIGEALPQTAITWSTTAQRRIIDDSALETVRWDEGTGSFFAWQGKGAAGETVILQSDIEEGVSEKVILMAEFDVADPGGYIAFYYSFKNRYGDSGGFTFALDGVKLSNYTTAYFLPYWTGYGRGTDWVRVMLPVGPGHHRLEWELHQYMEIWTHDQPNPVAQWFDYNVEICKDWDTDGIAGYRCFRLEPAGGDYPSGGLKVADVQVVQGTGLQAALDSPALRWGQSSGWFGQAEDTRDGVDAAQSQHPVIPGSGGTYSFARNLMSATLNIGVGGRLSFWYKTTGSPECAIEFFNVKTGQQYGEDGLYSNGEWTQWVQDIPVRSGVNYGEVRLDWVTEPWYSNRGTSNACLIDAFEFIPAVKGDTAAPTITAFDVMTENTNKLSVPVKISATDNVKVTGYLITTTSQKPDATATGWSATAPTSFTLPYPGSWTLYGWAKDAAGNVSDSGSDNVIVDATIPEVTSFDIVPEVSRTLGVAIAVDGTDEGGAGLVGYRLTETPAKPLAAARGWLAVKPTSYTFATAGNKSLYAWIKDAAGNVSNSRNDSVLIDIIAPNVSTFTLPAAWSGTTVPIDSFIATDDSGAVAGYLLADTAPKPLPTAPGWVPVPPATFSFAVGGKRLLYAWAKDTAGNVSLAKSAAVTVDVAAPIVSAFDLPAYRNTITVPLQAFIATDDVAVTGYLLTDSPATPSATAPGWTLVKPVSLPVSGPGTWTFYAWARDAAGNISTSQTDTVRVEMTPPVVTEFVVPALSASLNVPLAIEAADEAGGSDIGAYMVTETPMSPPATSAAWSAAKPTSYRCAVPGAKTLYAWAKDGAGNISTSMSAAVNIDIGLPVVTAFDLPAQAPSLLVPIVLFTAADKAGGTGIDGYLLTESSVRPDAAQRDWSADKPTSFLFGTAGLKRLYAWVRDRAGNVSVARTDTTVIDPVPPVVTSFTIPTTSKVLAVPVSAFTALDNTKVTGYRLSETSEVPLATASGWSVKRPLKYVFNTAGLKVLYAWARDAAGNVSQGKRRMVLVDLVKPTVTALDLPAAWGSLYVPVNVFEATDDVGVTGYLLTTTPNVPLHTDPRWSPVAPGIAILPGSGQRTVYAWARDAVGNVSFSRACIVTVENIAPSVTAFDVPALAETLEVPVTVFEAEDNIQVAGFLVTTSSRKPLASAPGWTTEPPTSVMLPRSGTWELYAWVKDAAGNVSGLARSAVVTPEQTSDTVDTVTIEKTLPVLSLFELPPTAVELTVPVTTLEATDNTGIVAGYLLTATSAKPSPMAQGWTAEKPGAFTFSGPGTRAVYAWAKDPAGNVSLPKKDTVVIEKTLPVVTQFTVPPISTSLTVPISQFEATDNTGVVAGYLVTVTSIKPLPGATGWSTIQPANFTFPSPGVKVLYGWAKDRAGNVSAFRSARVVIDAAAPRVTTFMVPATASSLVVPIDSLTAADNPGGSGIARYTVTLNRKKPRATAPGWSPTPPTSITVPGFGIRAVYAWAKDAVGNVSAPLRRVVKVVSADKTPPVVTVFYLATYHPGLATTMSAPLEFTATDENGVTGYWVSTSAIEPDPGAVGWVSDPPHLYEFPEEKTYTLYGWAKDAAGNVSAVATSSAVTVHLPDLLEVCPEGPPTCGYGTIQAAIDAAEEGDVIAVAGGTYQENVDYRGKYLEIRSTQGPGNTVIDGGGAGSAVVLDGYQAVLDGFTVTNGAAPAGGGVVVLETAAIFNCVISGNTAEMDGGGIFAYGSSLLLVEGTIISGNSAGYSGGGVYIFSPDPWAASPSLTNCTVNGNRAGFGGGALLLANSEGEVVNCTLAGNSGGVGGGIYAYQSTTALENVILWGNEDVLGASQIYEESLGLTVNSCDIEGGWLGSLDVDPLFVAPVEANQAPTAAGDYHIKEGSGCIDQGDGTTAPSWDIDGEGRPSGTGVDIGSDEFTPAAEPSLPNLLPNPSFEEGVGDVPDGWTPKPTGATFTWEDNPALAHEGSRATVISPPDTVWTAYGWLGRSVPVDPSHIYRLTGWYRWDVLPGAGEVMQLGYSAFNNERIPLGGSCTTQWGSFSLGEWSELALDIAGIHAGATNIDVEFLRFFSEDQPTEGSMVLIDDVKLVDLGPGAVIRGSVTHSGAGSPSNSILVRAWLDTGAWQQTVTTAVLDTTSGSQWEYQLGGLTPGRYTVEVQPYGGSYAYEFFDSAGTLRDATFFTLSAGEQKSLGTTQLELGGSIVVNVGISADEPPPENLQVILVTPPNDDGAPFLMDTSAGSLWSHSFTNLPDGRYNVQVRSSDGYYLSEYYYNIPYDPDNPGPGFLELTAPFNEQWDITLDHN